MHDPDRDPIDALAEEFVTAYRRGEEPSVDDYANRYPELADDIRELFPAATLLEDLKTPPGTPRPSPPPERLGDFRIVREIGRGGMGVVYEAEQGSLGRRVALKVLPANPRLSGEHLERFRREARAAGRLHHTNIVPVFGVGEHDGTAYYVMQLIAGQGLERVLARLRVAQAKSPPVPADPTSPVDVTPPPPLVGHATETWGDGGPSASPPASAADPDAPAVPAFDSPEYHRFVARLGAQVADALEHAHRQGILHRDVKPANLLLDREGTIWVTDFGLAKFLEQDDLTRPGEVAGTLRYSAPERFTGRSDARGDVYSLGLTLYELLTLRPAYGEPDPSRLLLQVTQGRIAPPRSVNPSVPRDLETVVLKCLAPEPDGRYGTAAELAADLRRFLEDRPVKARRIGPLARGWRWCRRNPAVASLSAALLLVVVAGFAGVAWGWHEAAASATRAKSALEREADEKRRAEKNLDLALEAFDQIGKQVASGRPGVPLDSGDETHVASVITPEVAALLQDLVGFQERFAEANSNDPRLKQKTATALRQVGTIRHRLGEADRAAEALERAANLLSGDADQKLELAQTYNDLGVVLRAGGKYKEAIASHHKAQEILDAWPAPSPPRVRLELARTFTFIGPLELRQNGPNATAESRLAALTRAEESQRRGLELLSKLVEEDAIKSECRHLLARSTFDLSILLRIPRPREGGKRPEWDPEEDWQQEERRAERDAARARALEIQEKLVAEVGDVPDYRAELAEMLLSGGGGPGGRGKEKPPPEVGQRLARAVELARALFEKNRAVPDYQALLARAETRLAQTQSYDEKTRDEALTNVRHAVKLMDDLIKRFPQATANYRLPSLDARGLLGELERERGDLAESEKVLRQTVEELKKALDASPRNRFLRFMLVRHARSLAKTLEGLGETFESMELLKFAGETVANQP